MAKKKKGIKAKLLSLFTIIAAVVFIPTTVLFLIGLMPSIIAGVMDPSREKSRLMTVGFANFAGLFPYWCQLIEKGHTLTGALNIVTDPSNIVIIYSAAVAGYIIEWGVSKFVIGIAIQNGKSRLSDIKKAQEALVKKWGPEVMGDLPLDKDGFPIE